MNIPQPPCQHCNAACCRRQPGNNFVAVLRDGEERQLSLAVKSESLGFVLPATDNAQCGYLDHDRCAIYPNRPRVCAEFNCAHGYWLWQNRHSEFLRHNPEVVRLLEQERPEFCDFRRQERQFRPSY